jgi:prepilin peptidase CpaA
MALTWAICGGFLKESLGGAGDLGFGFWRRGLRRHERLAPERLVLSNPAACRMPYAPAIVIGTIVSFLAVS